jgi:hypothetical protein
VLYYLSYSTSPFLCIFKIGPHEPLPGAGFNPWTAILLMSASGVARITDVCHWCPASDFLSIYRLYLWLFTDYLQMVLYHLTYSIRILRIYMSIFLFLDFVLLFFVLIVSMYYKLHTTFLLFLLYTVMYLFFFFWVGLEFELRVSCLQSRNSIV